MRQQPAKEHAGDEEPNEAKDTFASLARGMSSQEAFKFASAIYEAVVSWEREGPRPRAYKRRARTGHKLRDALGRVSADVLTAAADPESTGKVWRSPNANGFNEDDPVLYRSFRKATEAMTALGFLEHTKGQPRFAKHPDIGVNQQRAGVASKWRATPKLIALAAAHKIDLNNLDRHFKPDGPRMPRVPIRLRARSQGQGERKERGKIIARRQWRPGWESYADEMRELNDFLSRFAFGGASHHHYLRSFNIGDDTDFSWQFGGRLYSQATSETYQNVKREQRRNMTINGEAVTEVDVRASHLTIFYARVLKKPLPAPNPADPYDIPGQERDVVKTWINASIGNGRPIGLDVKTGQASPRARWPKDAKARFLKATGRDLAKAAKCGDVAAACLRVYPDLLRLTDDREVWATMHFIEASAIVGTMLELKRSYGIPALSMHDALIVPASKAKTAGRILSRHYREVVGVAPVLTFKELGR